MMVWPKKCCLVCKHIQKKYTEAEAIEIMSRGNSSSSQERYDQDLEFLKGINTCALTAKNVETTDWCKSFSEMSRSSTL